MTTFLDGISPGMLAWIAFLIGLLLGVIVALASTARAKSALDRSAKANRRALQTIRDMLPPRVP